MSDKNITIPLRWWLDLALKGRDYTVIDNDLAAQIRLVDPAAEICYIENGVVEGYVTLQPLGDNLVRCWSSKEWRRSYAAWKQAKEQSIRDSDERQNRLEHIATMRRDLIASYVSKSVPQSVAETLVNSTMSVEVVEIAWKQLKNIQ